MASNSRSAEALAYRKWYQSSQWRAIARAHRQAEPLCRMCAAKGRVVPGVDVDHIDPHRGDWQRFIAGPFQTLCKRCHSGIKQSIEARGYDTAIGADGYPADPKHPSNR